MKAQIPKYGNSIIDGTIYVIENAVSPSGIIPVAAGLSERSHHE